MPGAGDSRTSGVTDAFVPALGFALLTPLYDAALAIATRERVWRTALLEQVARSAGEMIIDVGCDAGTLAVLPKRGAPSARGVGIDPAPETLALAARKAGGAGAISLFACTPPLSTGEPE